MGFNWLYISSVTLPLSLELLIQWLPNNSLFSAYKRSVNLSWDQRSTRRIAGLCNFQWRDSVCFSQKPGCNWTLEMPTLHWTQECLQEQAWKSWLKIPPINTFYFAAASLNKILVELKACVLFCVILVSANKRYCVDCILLLDFVFGSAQLPTTFVKNYRWSVQYWAR